MERAVRELPTAASAGDHVATPGLAPPRRVRARVPRVVEVLRQAAVLAAAGAVHLAVVGLVHIHRRPADAHDEVFVAHGVGWYVGWRLLVMGRVSGWEALWASIGLWGSSTGELVVWSAGMDGRIGSVRMLSVTGVGMRSC